MFVLLVRMAGVMSLGLVAGGALCIFFLERSFAGDAAFYTQYKQLQIRALTDPLPALALVALLTNAYDCFGWFRRGFMLPFGLSLGALVLNLIAMALTRGGHFPLNAEILTWNAGTPPGDWSLLQAKWWALHVGRTITSLAAFALLLLGALWPSGEP